MVDNRIVLSDIWQDPTGSSTFMLKSSAGQNWGPIFIRLTIVGVKILRWKKEPHFAIGGKAESLLR